MIYRCLTILAVLATIVVSALLGGRPLGKDDLSPVRQEGEEPGYAARDAQLIETGADGRPLYTLDADVIRQRPKDGTIYLDKVRMSYRAENSSQWALSAEHGQIAEANERIELSGDVRVVGILPGTSELAQILTAKLAFDTQAEIASTPEPVTLVWGGRQLHGTGLVASLKDRQVKLESAVHGRFTP